MSFCEEYRDWFLTEDAVHLCSTLSCITHPKYCLTRLIASSSHRVYGVNLPKLYTSILSNQSKRNVFGVTDGKYDYCIKVILDEQAYTVEAQAVNAVSVKYNAYGCERYYALGVHPLNLSLRSDASPVASAEESISSELVSMHISERMSHDHDIDIDDKLAARVKEITKNVEKFINTVAVNDRACLTLIRPSLSFEGDDYWHTILSLIYQREGGTILMRVGQQVKLSIDDCSSWFDGVHICLRATHEAGYFHCDIRASNVLLFDQIYQLIDYDHSVSQANPTFRLIAGAQFDSRGIGMRSFLLGDEVTWTYHDDYEMLSAVLSKLKQRN
jgi:hypothetical protein